MENFNIVVTNQAKKDRDKIKQYPVLANKVTALVKQLKVDPFVPPYEKLIGADNLYSRALIKSTDLFTVFTKKSIR